MDKGDAATPDCRRGLPRSSGLSLATAGQGDFYGVTVFAPTATVNTKVLSATR